MTQYSAQSAEVLNEADEMNRRLDFVIFSQENAVDESEPGWVPGDYLYEHPYDLPDDSGVWVRPMIQSLSEESNWFVPRCEPCGVLWVGNKSKCWICGEEREPAKMTYEQKMMFSSFTSRYRRAASLSADPVLYPGEYEMTAMDEFEFQQDLADIRRELMAVDVETVAQSVLSRRYDRNHPSDDNSDIVSYCETDIVLTVSLFTANAVQVEATEVCEILNDGEARHAQ